MTLQLGGPIPCWHVSPSLLLLLLFVFINIININKGRDKSGAHTFWLSMGLYMGLGMDLLASTFERLQILALQFIKNLCPWPTKKIVKLESKSAEWKYQNRFSSIWMS